MCVRGNKSSIDRIIHFHFIYTLLSSCKTANYPNVPDYQNHLGCSSKLQNPRLYLPGQLFSTEGNLPPGNSWHIWRHCGSHNWRVLLAPSEQRPGMLLSILKPTGQPPKQRIIWVNMSTVLQPRNPYLEILIQWSVMRL